MLTTKDIIVNLIPLMTCEEFVEFKLICSKLLGVTNRYNFNYDAFKFGRNTSSFTKIGSITNGLKITYNVLKLKNKVILFVIVWKKQQMVLLKHFIK